MGALFLSRLLCLGRRTHPPAGCLERALVLETAPATEWVSTAQAFPLEGCRHESSSRIRIQRMLLRNYSPAEASLTAVGSSHSAQSSRGQHQHIDVVFVHHCARKDHLSVWSSSKSLDDIWPAECQKHFYHFALACTHESHHVVPNCRSCHSGPQVIA